MYLISICIIAAGKWRQSKTLVDSANFLPEDYFYDVEAHHGGCGTFEWTKKWNQQTKFALGIAFSGVSSDVTASVTTVDTGKHCTCNLTRNQTIATEYCYTLCKLFQKCRTNLVFLEKIVTQPLYDILSETCAGARDLGYTVSGRYRLSVNGQQFEVRKCK